MFTWNRAVLACASIATTPSWAAAPTYTTSGSGSVSSFTTTETGTGTNVWNVALTAAGATTSPYFTVTISGAGSPVVRNLDVISNDSGKVVRVSITSNILRVENVHQTGGSGELWLESIKPSEEIGETSRGGEIIVDRIQEIRNSVT